MSRLTNAMDWSWCTFHLCGYKLLFSVSYNSLFSTHSEWRMEKWENLYAEALHKRTKKKIPNPKYQWKSAGTHKKYKNERHPLKVLSMWHVSVCLCAVLSGGGMLKMFQLQVIWLYVAWNKHSYIQKIANSYTIWYWWWKCYARSLSLTHSHATFSISLSFSSPISSYLNI